MLGLGKADKSEKSSVAQCPLCVQHHAGMGRVDAMPHRPQPPDVPSVGCISKTGGVGR